MYTSVFSPDDTRLVTSAEESTLLVWDVKSCGVAAELKGHEGPVLLAKFSPNGRRLVTASSENTARLWDPISNTLVAELRGAENDLEWWRTIFSPDGKAIVTTHDSDGSVYLWDSETGAAIAELEGKDSFAFSIDSLRLATVSSKSEVKIWDSRSGAAVNSFPGKSYPSHSSVSFSHDGRYVVTVGEYEAEVAYVESGIVIAKLESRTRFMDSAQFGPDDREVWTTSADGTITIWRIPHCNDAIESAKKIVPRQLSDAERARFFLQTQNTGVLVNAYNKIRPWIAWAMPASADVCR